MNLLNGYKTYQSIFLRSNVHAAVINTFGTEFVTVFNCFVACYLRSSVSPINNVVIYGS